MAFEAKSEQVQDRPYVVLGKERYVYTIRGNRQVVDPRVWGCSCEYETRSTEPPNGGRGYGGHYRIASMVSVSSAYADLLT
jgi:hypothetical protein